MALNNAVMTNEALKAIMDEYTTRVKCIKCACRTILLNCNYHNNVFTVDQIKYKTVGMIDYFEIPQYNTATGGTCLSVIPTETVGEIIVADNERDPIDVYHI